MQCVREFRAKKGHYPHHNKKPEALRARVALKRDYDRRNPERALRAAAKGAAKAKGLPFDLELSDIQIPATCPVLGIELKSGRGLGGRLPSSPSLDRIVASLGYTKGNVIVVSWKANKIKSDASVDDLRKIADFYEKLGKGG